MNYVQGSIAETSHPPADAGQCRGFSTRTYLIALSLLLVIPVLAIAAYVTYRFVESEHQRFEQQARDLARRGVLAIEREFADFTATLELLATSPTLDTGDLGEFHRQASEAAAILDAIVTLRDLASTQLVNTYVPWGSKLPRASLADADREVLRTGKPVVSDHYIPFISNDARVAVVVPVRRNGQIRYFLSAAFKPERMRAALAKTAPLGWRSVIIDRKGIVIANTGSQDRSGQLATQEFRAAVGRGDMEYRGLSLDGKPVFNSLERTSFGWTVASGGPSAAFAAELNRALAFIALGAAALLLLALAAALLLARQISRPVMRLARLADRVGKGEAAKYKPTANLEVNAVARQLAMASDELRRRRRELKQRAEEWKTILNTVPAGVWFTRDRGAERIEATALGARLIRMEPEANASLTGPEEQRPSHVTLYRAGRLVEDATTLPMQRAAMLGETVLNEELEFRYTDGSSQFLLFNAAPLFGLEGAPAGAVGAAIDITERKRAESLAFEQAGLLELVASSAPQAECLTAITAALARLQPGLRACILLADADRRVLEASFAADVPASFSDGVKGAVIEELAIGTCGAAVFTGEPVACPDIANDTRWAQAWRDLCIVHGIRACYSQPVAAANGQCFGSLMLCFDRAREASDWERKLAGMGSHIASIAIERSRAIQALSDSEEQLRLIADATPALISYVDAGERYRFNNKAYEDWFGHSRDEITGKTLSEVLGEEAMTALRPHVDAALGGQTVSFSSQVPYRDGGTRYIEATYIPARKRSGEVRGFYVFVTDISERKSFDEARTLLINELNHRVKNTLATVQSIAAQTLRNAGVDKPIREALESRLLSLAQAHDILTRENWSGANLRDVVSKALTPFRAEDRFTVAGPDVWLTPRAALAIALALHELATNAVKYGALSKQTGSVTLRWQTVLGTEGWTLTLRWTEQGGPPVKPPSRKGFGSRLIERGLAGDLGGEAKMDYRSTGLVCTIIASLPKLSRGGGQ